MYFSKDGISPSQRRIMEKAFLKTLIPALEKCMPQNPVVAFDADGTLWPRDVGKDFFQWQVKRGLLKEKTKDPQAEFNRIRERKGRKFALIWLAEVQAGWPVQKLNQWIRDFLKQHPVKMFGFQETLLEWFDRHNVQVFVVSSSLKWVLDQALKPYPIPTQNIIGVQTKVEKGIITETPILPAPIHKDKVPAFKNKTGGQCPFFVAGNTLADQALLEFSSQFRLVVATARPKDRNYESEQKMLNIAIDRAWFYWNGLLKPK